LNNSELLKIIKSKY